MKTCSVVLQLFHAERDRYDEDCQQSSISLKKRWQHTWVSCTSAQIIQHTSLNQKRITSSSWSALCYVMSLRIWSQSPYCPHLCFPGWINEVWHWCCGNHLLGVSTQYSVDKEEIKQRKTTTTQVWWISTQFLHQDSLVQETPWWTCEWLQQSLMCWLKECV